MHLSRSSVILCLYVSLISLSASEGNINVFKINKLNLVWTKAQHSLGPSKLKSLKEDLLKHELDEISLKRMKSHNQDKNGLLEAAVRKKLLSLLTKYAIERYIDDIHPIPDDKKRLNDPTSRDSKTVFRDAKLDKLWKKAEKSGFTQEQLMMLHEEFENHQKKLEHHYDTSDHIDDIQREKSLEHDQKWDNSIENEIEHSPKGKMRKESESEKKARLDSNIHQSLKEKHKELKEGYARLHKKIIDKTVHDQPYEETQVNQLWVQAIQANFTDDELNMLRDDLENYQIRLQKLRHFQNQLDRNNIGSLSKESKSYIEEDQEAKHVRKRVEELTRHVDKTHKAIEKMIKSRGEEL